MTEQLNENCTPNNCICKAEDRTKQCEHEDRTNETYQEQRKFGIVTLHVMKRCEKSGTLRTDCNSMWDHKQVLCDEHAKIESHKLDRKCRICGTAIRSCCC